MIPSNEENASNPNPQIHIDCKCGYNSSLGSLKEKYMKNISSDVKNLIPSGKELIDILDIISTTFDFDSEDSIMLFVHRICKELLITNVEYAYRMLREYIKYMALLVLRGLNKIPLSLTQMSLVLIPSAKIFSLWRFHILYSSKYIEFCHKLNNGRRIHLDINKFFNLEVFDSEEEMSNFKASYENTIEIYKLYYGEITHPEMWPEFHKNTIEYTFRFCLFSQNYKFLNEKHSFEENDLIPRLLTKSKELTLESFRKEILTSLNNLRETTGMTITELKEATKKQKFEEDPELSANEKIYEFFNGNISVINEIKSNDHLWKKYKYCCTFLFPDNFEYILSHEMLLHYNSIKKLTLDYRRFLFLRCYRPKMMFTPSEEVDVVWHLHLNFTSIYYQTTIQLLGYEYLHNPTKGGKKELEKHTSLYDSTLDVYKKLFGDVSNLNWPGGKERFTQNPYWFVLTEKYLQGRLERVNNNRKLINEENNDWFEYLKELSWKIKLLMVFFLIFCVVVGGWIGYLTTVKGLYGKMKYNNSIYINQGGD